MAIYKYRGVNAKGKNVKATIQADSPTELKQILKSQGVILSDYQQLSEKRQLRNSPFTALCGLYRKRKAV